MLDYSATEEKPLMKRPFVDFENKVILVSGATSGIGRGIARMLGDHGARLILVGRNAERFKALSNSLSGVKHWCVPLDLSRNKDIGPVLTEAVEKSGPIYGLCHSAGIAQLLPLESSNFGSIQEVLDVNFLAGIEMARVMTNQGFMEPDGGSILFISSICGIVGTPNAVAYCASKGALNGAARSMAIELAKRNIRVNLLSPGVVLTEMTREIFSETAPAYLKELKDGHPLRTGTVEDVARAAVFLLAPQNSWITGANLVIDGGYTAH